MPRQQTGFRCAREKRWRYPRNMKRKKLSKEEYEAMAKRIAERVQPGTIVGRRAGSIPEREQEHFYLCKACGQAVDMRDLGQVFHHEVPAHSPLPEN